MTKPKKIRNADPNDNLRRCLHHLVEERLRLMLFYADKSLSSRDIEMLHKMRVSTRRLQSYLKIFGELYSKKKFRPCYATLRKLLQESGRVRELDILIATLSEYRSTISAHAGTVVDILIAKKIHERRVAQKLLSRSLREMHRDDFQGQLLSFSV